MLPMYVPADFLQYQCGHLEMITPKDQNSWISVPMYDRMVPPSAQGSMPGSLVVYAIRGAAKTTWDSADQVNKDLLGGSATLQDSEGYLTWSDDMTYGFPWVDCVHTVCASALKRYAGMPKPDDKFLTASDRKVPTPPWDPQPTGWSRRTIQRRFKRWLTNEARDKCDGNDCFDRIKCNAELKPAGYLGAGVRVGQCQNPCCGRAETVEVDLELAPKCNLTSNHNAPFGQPRYDVTEQAAKCTALFNNQRHSMQPGTSKGNPNVPDCASRFETKLTWCNTCCCAKGLTTLGATHMLIHGSKAKCGAWLSSLDLIMRNAMSLLRTMMITLDIAPRCFGNSDKFKTLPFADGIHLD